MAESLNTLYSELFQRVMEDDEASQRYYLSMIESQRHISVDYLLQIGALFIPNNDYIRHYLGDRVKDSIAGLYYGDTCPWTLFVVIPIRDLSGDIKGLVGWDAYNKFKEVSEGAQGLVSYRVSAKSVFPRERYFLSDIECLKRNFSYRVVLVTDGVFDCVSLNYRDLPAIALLGSSFSPEILYFLGWYSHVYVCADNDKAGLSLFNKLSRALPNVHRIIQHSTKDVEEYLRPDGVDGPTTKRLQELVRNPCGSDIYLQGVRFSGHKEV